MEASPCVISRFIWLPLTSMHQARIIYILAAPTKTTVRVSVYHCMACVWRLVDPTSTWGTGGGAQTRWVCVVFVVINTYI